MNTVYKHESIKRILFDQPGQLAPTRSFPLRRRRCTVQNRPAVPNHTRTQCWGTGRARFQNRICSEELKKKMAKTLKMGDRRSENNLQSGILSQLLQTFYVN